MSDGLKARVIVLGIGRYSFPDQTTGEIIEGSKVHYVEVNPQEEKDAQGYVPTVANMPLAYYDQITAIPGIYDAEMNIKMSGKKPSLKVTGFTFISPVEFVG
ncbi:MAG: hypothetical protein K6T85_00770 [Gorillibacterium sp.]|nr:hypothetical protein [Gorillibacterium sp.]